MRNPLEWALDELERLINDPDVPMHPGRVWELAEYASGRTIPWSHRGEARIGEDGGGVLLS